MFTAKITSSKIVYDSKRHYVAIQKQLQKDFKNALREWLLAVVARVPVYSGEARGSLLPIAKVLGISFPINPDPEALKKSPNHNIETGEEKGLAKLKITNTTLSLEIDNQVLHYRINEFNDMQNKYPEIWGRLKTPTPWVSFQYGKDAYYRYIKANFKKNSPKLKLFTSIVRTKVN